MSPIDLDMLPIYERMLSIEQERARGRAFRSLIAHAGVSKDLPSWFAAYPRTPFASQRGRTVRFRIDPKDMSLQWVLPQLEGLTPARQAIEIKRVLRNLCVAPSSPTHAPSHSVALIDEQKQTASASVPTVYRPTPIALVADPDGDEGEIRRQQSIKNSSAAFY